MRWFWIDRFTEFVSGKYAVGRKGVSLSEESVDEYAPGRTYLPSALIIEGLAQAGGLLIGQTSDFLDRVVLAKVQKSKFYCHAFPGDTLTYRVELENLSESGGFIIGTSHLGDKLQAEINLIFSILDDERFENVELFEPAALCRMCRLLRLFEVGVHEDGTPIKVPPHMVEAEKLLLLEQ